MRNSPFQWILAAAAAVAVVTGCDCDRPKTDKRYGEIGVVYDEGGVSKTSTNAVYDFGPVFMGQKAELKLVVKNLGSGGLGLTSLEKESGNAVMVAGVGEMPAVFEVGFEAKELGAGELIELPLTFIPPQNDVEKVVDHEAVLVLRASNTAAGAETARITLRGKAVSGVCELPKVLDFGAVAKGDSFTQSVEVRNPSQLEATAFVGDIYSTSGDHLAFAFTVDSARGTFVVPPSGSKKVSVAFSPTEMRAYLAFVKMRASAQCPEYAVQLKGTGVDNVLTWAPAVVDFGYVTPGAKVTKELTFTNAGNVDASLTNVGTSAMAEFKRVPEAGQDPTTLTVPGKGGTAKLLLSFQPSVLGPRAAILSFKTSLPKQPTGQVQLKGYGGGPDIQVNPSPTLNFGKIACFQTGTCSYQTRKLTVMNVGTKPAVPDPSANLKLGKAGAGQPYFEIKALNASSALSEIDIPIPATSGKNSYDPNQGLEASAGKNLVDLIVKITPAPLPSGVTSVTKEFEVTIFSNDPDEPEVKVVVKADATEMPPCNYSVSPTALNFGLVTPPSYKDLTFTIKNLGQNAGDLCLLSSLDVQAGSDPIFTLPAGPVASKELQPGEAYTVTARAWPQGQASSTLTNVTGNVEFFMSSPTVPQKVVKLDATVAIGCLTIAPNDVDFGTVQKGCNSATRNFNVYNTCPAAVTINSFAVQAPAGQPAGGPNCPGTTACPEFFLVNAGVPPINVPSGGSPISFGAKYKPIDIGSDNGAIALNVTQSGQNVTYVVTLQGKGDTVGLNNDVFVQDAKPKADILLVIDNSCSMYDEQQSLSTNFASFIKYAVSAGVDYHIGVTTTDMDSGGEQGKLLGDSTNPKVLTPTTPDVENKFKTKVSLGTSGSGWEKCFEPSLNALTAPLITSDNVGFLRNDASLAIVCITDELEQSPQAPTYYFNNLMNIKGVKRANMFTYNAIAGFVNPMPAGCQYDYDDGRYAQMVGWTNGVKENICTPNWAKALEQLGKTAFGFRTNFFLNGSPDLTGGKTITVKIDGVTIPAVDSRGSTVWTYDPVANSVNFEPMFVPEPGQTLTITYYVTCF